MVRFPRPSLALCRGSACKGKPSLHLPSGQDPARLLFHSVFAQAQGQPEKIPPACVTSALASKPILHSLSSQVCEPFWERRASDCWLNCPVQHRVEYCTCASLPQQLSKLQLTRIRIDERQQRNKPVRVTDAPMPCQEVSARDHPVGVVAPHSKCSRPKTLYCKGFALCHEPGNVPHLLILQGSREGLGRTSHDRWRQYGIQAGLSFLTQRST